jgi:hypothetical protein
MRRELAQKQPFGILFDFGHWIGHWNSESSPLMVACKRVAMALGGGGICFRQRKSEKFDEW